MRIFDPHIHMTSRTTDDYEAMAAAGVRAVVEPAFWLGQPRTNVGLLRRLLRLAARLGAVPGRAVRHRATTARSRSTPRRPTTRAAAPVLDLLPRYLAKDGVVAVGEIGYDSMTPEEDEAFAAQLALAVEHDLPALVHTPHRDKLAGTQRTLDVVEESGHRARAGSSSTTSTRSPSTWSPTPAAGWASPSIPTPRCRRRPDGRDPAARTAWSGCWSTRPPTGAARDPLLTAATGRGDARGRVQRRRRRPGAVAQPGGVLRPVRPARPRSTTPATARRPPSRATRSCAEAADAAAPSRRQPRAPGLLHQRAPGRGPGRHRSPSSTRTPCRSASASAPTCSGSACGWPRRSPRALAARPRGRAHGCAASSTRAGWRW